MKLIIDIPEAQYNFIKLSDKSVFADASSKECMLNSIKNGTPYEERPQGDSISREALKNDLITFFPDKCLEGITAKTLFKQILTDIDNAPTVSDRYDEGYAQGYIDGSTGADWKGGAK